MIKSTVDEANTYINQLYTSLNVDEISINTIRMNVAGAMIPSGTWDIITSKTYSDYGYQIAMSFAKGGIRFRKLSGGIWSDWDAYVQINDLEKYFPPNKPYPYIGNGTGVPGGSKNVVLDVNPSTKQISVYFEGTNIGYVTLQ